MLSVLESLPLPPIPREEKQVRSLPWHFFAQHPIHVPYPVHVSIHAFHQQAGFSPVIAYVKLNQIRYQKVIRYLLTNIVTR